MISSHEIETMVRLYGEGKSLREVAEHVGATYKTVSSHLRKQGVEIDPCRRVSRYPLELEHEVVRLYQDRIGSTEIAKRLGLSSQTVVYSILKKHGVQAHGTTGTDRSVGTTYIDSDGYVVEKVDKSWLFYGTMPGQGGNGTWIRQHRKVMAEHLGRPLLRRETVHHIDGDRTNNTLENLQLRQSAHGPGVRLCCSDCGSTNVTAAPLAY
jgi:DNA-binding CsgD family transcriptional regulator